MLTIIKAIYFDLDNTLINRDSAFWLCLKCFMNVHLPNIDAENEKELILIKDNFGYNSRTDFSKWFICKYQPKDITEEYFFEYQVKNISNYITESTDELLQFLKELKQKYDIGIITNGSENNQKNKIKQAKLDSIFDSTNTYISGRYNTAKPDIELFEIALENLNIEPSALLYVGDNPKNDIFAPKQLGIKTCWLSRQRKWKENYSFDFEIKSILDLKNY